MLISFDSHIKLKDLLNKYVTADLSKVFFLKYSMFVCVFPGKHKQTLYVWRKTNDKSAGNAGIKFYCKCHVSWLIIFCIEL